MGKRKVKKSTKRSAKRAATKVVRVNANLYSGDIERVRELASDAAVSTSIKLRQILHDALNPLKAYKFFVNANEKVTIPLGPPDEAGNYPSGVIEINDCCATCAAHDMEEALQLLEAYAVRDGLDGRWLRHAPHKVEIPLDSGPAFLMWAAH